MKQKSFSFDKMEDHAPSSYKGIYAMHKYWSKKPFNLVANYIARYSGPGDTVLDPFCGSGVTIVESVRLQRKVLGFDINPIAVFLTKRGLERVDVGKLKESYEVIKSNTMPLVEKLYRTRCPECTDEHALATHLIWQDGKISEVWVSCETCRTSKTSKTPDCRDIETVQSLDYPESWYPTASLYENARINAKSGMKISDLFTKRALHCLSFLLSEIQKIEDVPIRNTLLLCFSASLPQASRMVFVIRRRGKTSGVITKPRAEVGSWVIGYWIPKEHFEINVWRCFENRFKRIVRGKMEISDAVPRVAKECISAAHLAITNEGFYVDTGDAACLPVENESVDYIFTDPPHGNRLPYLELSLMWNSWLGLTNINWDDEIVVSAAKTRKKNRKDYRKRLAVALRELWRVLKPGKFMSIAFNSLDDGTWLSLLNSCTQVGFNLQEIQPLKYSATSVVQDNRKNALKTDFVLTFCKELPLVRGEIVLRRNRNAISGTIRMYLERNPSGPIQTYDILNHVIVSQARNGCYMPIKMILEVLHKDFQYVESSWQV